MKIDLVITELHPGGAERALTNLAIGFKERGDHVRVTSLAPLPDPPRNMLVARLEASEIEVQSVGLRGLMTLFAASKRLASRLKANQPEIVQSFLFHANALTAWSLAHLENGARPLHISGIRVAEPSRFRSFLESRLSRHMSGGVCVSRSVEAFVKRSWKPHPDFTLVSIPNGLGLDSIRKLSEDRPFDWVDWGLSTTKPVVLFVGRMHPQKGIDWFLDHAPRVLAAFPQVQWVLIGEGPLETRVRATISKLGTDRMVWKPWQCDTAPLFRAAEIVFLPSRYEGMPNVVLEAMAAAKPVLSTNVEGIEELLGEDLSVQSFPVGDAELMIQRLGNLLDPQLRWELGIRNQRRLVAEFSLERIVDRYRHLYKDLLDRSKR